jgi:hypothetical protein
MPEAEFALFLPKKKHDEKERKERSKSVRESSKERERNIKGTFKQAQLFSLDAVIIISCVFRRH